MPKPASIWARVSCRRGVTRAAQATLGRWGLAAAITLTGDDEYRGPSNIPLAARELCALLTPLPFRSVAALKELGQPQVGRASASSPTPSRPSANSRHRRLKIRSIRWEWSLVARPTQSGPDRAYRGDSAVDDRLELTTRFSEDGRSTLLEVAALLKWRGAATITTRLNSGDFGSACRDTSSSLSSVRDGIPASAAPARLRLDQLWAPLRSECCSAGGTRSGSKTSCFIRQLTDETFDTQKTPFLSKGHNLEGAL